MDTQRYPISVRLVGVMHKDKSKMYMTSVLWSDQSDIVIYRTFRDFKKMHVRMLESCMYVCMYVYKKLKRSGKKKSSTRSMLCLKFLQKYCNELLSCDPRVSQSAELIQFFDPKDQDLQPDFAKNSIIIMPSEDEVRTEARHGNAGNVTQPFVTETYRCVAPYETKDTKNKPFKVAMDEKVDVLIKDKAGWWLVESEDKRMAWFPAPYLEALDEDQDEDDIDGTPERGMLYTAVKSYKATKDDEITVAMGAVVEVIQKSENGWWLIRYNGKVGYIPSIYLKPYNYPHVHMRSSPHDFRIAAPSLQQQQSRLLSSSQGSQLQLQPVRSSSPHQLQADSRQKSASLNILSEQAPTQPAARTFATNIAIATDFSFSDDLSDDLSSSEASFAHNLSVGARDEQLRLSRTPTATSYLSPASGLEGKMVPSVSDPNLYKGPTMPKVPPRPRAQEILTRCTTITRKKASRASPTPTQIVC
uniref:SH3 domain-containing protein n=1 Tax=Mola mola TaxID=94237 RepID=A0A3Q3W652_MOLML